MNYVTFCKQLTEQNDMIKVMEMFLIMLHLFNNNKTKIE